MSSMETSKRQQIMQILKKEEEQTDLENLAVLSRVGLRVASADSTDLDADAVNASSTALTDLGIKLSEATDHGSLKEILLHNESGYSILIAINNEYIIFSALKAMYRVGYYLAYLRDLSRKLNKLISGDEESVMSLSLEESEKEKLEAKEEEKPEKKKSPLKPSVEQDKEALDGILDFFDEWSPESAEDVGELEGSPEDNIVSIPESNVVSIPSEEAARVGGKEIPEGPSEESLESLASVAEGATTPTSTEAKLDTGVKVYDDEIPPVPLEDYTPIMVEEGMQGEQATQISQVEEAQPTQEEEIQGEQATQISQVEEAQPTLDEEPPAEVEETEELPPLEEVPDFDEVNTPDFGSMEASEYETDFVLDEETEDLDEALEELGYEEEEE
ncbi:MAG: hypothetical protein R6U96_02495 [Promethearchaeia archaeon]